MANCSSVYAQHLVLYCNVTHICHTTVCFCLLSQYTIALYYGWCWFYGVYSQTDCDLQQQQVLVGQLLQEVNQLSQDLQGLVGKIFEFVVIILLLRMVTSVSQLITYLGLNKDPSDSEYTLRQRALICYIAHAIALILRRAKTCSDLGLESPVNHPTYGCIMPLLSNISIPLLRWV